MPKPRYKTTNWKQYNQSLINRGSLTCCASILCVWLRCSKYPEVHFITGLNIAIRPFNARQYLKSLIQRSKKLLTTAKAEMTQGEPKKNCLKAARKFKCITDSKHQMLVAPTCWLRTLTQQLRMKDRQREHLCCDKRRLAILGSNY